MAQEQDERFSGLPTQEELCFSVPLYKEFSLAGRDAEAYINYLRTHRATTDQYCVWCQKTGPFWLDALIPQYVEADVIRRANSGLGGTSHSVMSDTNQFVLVGFSCARNVAGHKYEFYFRVRGTSIVKVGQSPSLADIEIGHFEPLRKHLSKEKARELATGLGLSAYGVGIGAFVYLRRVFESLVEEALAEATAEHTVDLEQYTKERMDGKILLLSDYLPDFMVENRALYSILSAGVHNLNEDDCLAYLPVVREGIESMLEEKREKAERKARKERTAKAIAVVQGKLKGRKEPESPSPPPPEK